MHADMRSTKSTSLLHRLRSAMGGHTQAVQLQADASNYLVSTRPAQATCDVVGFYEGHIVVWHKKYSCAPDLVVCSPVLLQAADVVIYQALPPTPCLRRRSEALQHNQHTTSFRDLVCQVPGMAICFESGLALICDTCMAAAHNVTALLAHLHQTF